MNWLQTTVAIMNFFFLHLMKCCAISCSLCSQFSHCITVSTMIWLFNHSQFNKLKKISFFEMNVSRAGPAGEMGRLCPYVCDVDLSRCLLASWERVAEVAGQFPCLREVNVRCVKYFILDWSLMIDRLKEKFLKPWKGVLSIHFCACVSVHLCMWATEHSFGPRNLIFG